MTPARAKYVASQRQLLRFIADYQAKNAKSPSLQECARELGMRTSSAHKRMIVLEETGHIRRPAGRQRCIQLLPQQVQP